MLDSERGNKIKVIACVVFFIFMVLYILLAPGGRNGTKKKEQSVDVVAINEKFDNIKDNYSVSIKETKDGIFNNINISTNSSFYLYDGSLLEKAGYIYYKDKFYYIDEEEYKLVSAEADSNIASNPYYDVFLLENVVKKCNYTYKSKNETNCTVFVKQYLEDYNVKYSKNIETDSSDTISMVIKYSANKIVSINIDYSNLTELIDGVHSDLTEEITFNEFDSVLFNEIYENYIKNL